MSRRIVPCLLPLLGMLINLSGAEAVPLSTTPVPPPRTLTLVEAVQLAAATAPVGIAKLETAIAQAGYGAERMSLLPRLYATGNLSRQATAQTSGDEITRYTPYNDIGAQLHLGQTLLDLEAWHRTKAADRQLAAAEASATAALEEAAANAGSAYASLASAQALVVVRQDDLRLAEELFAQAKHQVDAGSAEAISATRAANRVETAKASLITAEGTVRRNRILLARALDLEPSLTLIAGQPLDEQLAVGELPTDAEKAERTALAVRPELRVSRETLTALEESRKAARGAELPKLDSFAAGGRGGPELDNTETTWRIGVGLTVPLIDASGFRSEQATLRVAQERLRLRQTSDRIKAEVREALTVIKTAQARLVSDHSRRTLANEELTQARARFDAGAAGNLEVIDAQRNVVAAQESLVQSTEALIQARVRLARAIGAATGLK